MSLQLFWPAVRRAGLHFSLFLVITCGLMAGSTVSAGTALQFGGPAVSAGGETSPRPSFEDVSHADLDALLHHYVDGDGQVCYSKWQDHQCDVQRLGGYIMSLTFVDPSLPSSQEAMMSYHINAYNALAIWGILREYPVASIQRIDGKRTSFAIFDDLQMWVGDQYLSLNSIENDVLRPLGDPRVHFGRTRAVAARGRPHRRRAPSHDR